MGNWDDWDKPNPPLQPIKLDIIESSPMVELTPEEVGIPPTMGILEGVEDFEEELELDFDNVEMEVSWAKPTLQDELNEISNELEVWLSALENAIDLTNGLMIRSPANQILVDNQCNKLREVLKACKSGYDFKVNSVAKCLMNIIDAKGDEIIYDLD